MSDVGWRISDVGWSIADRGSRIADRADEGALLERQGGFAGVMARAQESGGTVESRAREAAEQLVSIALVQPLLAQLRNGNHMAPPFAPSQGEKQFQGVLDAQVAQRITRASGFGLVDRLTEVLLKKARGGGDAAKASVETDEPRTK